MTPPGDPHRPSCTRGHPRRGQVVPSAIWGCVHDGLRREERYTAYVKQQLAVKFSTHTFSSALSFSLSLSPPSVYPFFWMKQAQTKNHPQSHAPLFAPSHSGLAMSLQQVGLSPRHPAPHDFHSPGLQTACLLMTASDENANPKCDIAVEYQCLEEWRIPFSVAIGGRRLSKAEWKDSSERVNIHRRREMKGKQEKKDTS